MTRSQLVFGVTFVALGTLLLLDAAEVNSAGPIVADWWPSIVILAGLAQVLTRPRNAVGGATIGVIGVALLLWTLDIVDSLALLWPLLLIGLGLWFLTRRPQPPREGRITADGEIVAVFDDRTVRTPPGPLAGQVVTAIFGDLDLDLRDTTIEDAATLSVTTIFGDVLLEVPPQWRVTVSGPEIFGDVSVQPSSEPAASAPVLHLQVVTIFGDIEVRARSAASL